VAVSDWLSENYHGAVTAAAFVLLGAAPEQCLVLEDSASGVESATRAEMTVWAVNTTVRIEGASRTFNTLVEAVPHVLRMHGSDR
jgi:beta-phosphoglucomutase-like phosphatase (HAD superfamily)